MAVLGLSWKFMLPGTACPNDIPKPAKEEAIRRWFDICAFLNDPLLPLAMELPEKIHPCQLVVHVLRENCDTDEVSILSGELMPPPDAGSFGDLSTEP